MKSQIPTWILVYGGIIGVFGLGAGLFGLYSPKPFAPDLALDRMAVWSNASRNVALGVGICIALLLRNPSAIFVVFCTLFLVDSIDLGARLVDHKSRGVAVSLFSVVPVLLFSLSYAFIAFKMWPMVKVENPL